MMMTKGEKISIIATGYGDCPDDVFQGALKDLDKFGYTGKYTKGFINDKIPYHANTDEFRAEDLYRALTDEETNIVWCLKGGYGSGRLVPLIKGLPKPKKPKHFIGFSDITCLHLFLSQEWGFTCIHGPNATNGCQPEKYDPKCYKEVHDILAGKNSEFSLNFTSLNGHSANVEAPLIGGNLSLCANSIGTSWQIGTKGKIIVFEDIDEHGYAIDKYLNHMKQVGLFEGVKAVVFGDFGHEKIEVKQSNADFALKRFAEESDFPVVRVKDIGHLKVNHPFVYGSPGKLDFANKTFKF